MDGVSSVLALSSCSFMFFFKNNKFNNFIFRDCSVTSCIITLASHQCWQSDSFLRKTWTGKKKIKHLTNNLQPVSSNCVWPLLAVCFISPGPQTSDLVEPLTFLHFSTSLSQAHIDRLSLSTPAASGKDSTTLLLFYYMALWLPLLPGHPHALTGSAGPHQALVKQPLHFMCPFTRTPSLWSCC